MKITKLLLILAILALSCSSPEKKTDSSEFGRWKLGWRMIASSWDNDHQLAENQFDSLLTMNADLEPRFLIMGIQSLHTLGKEEKIISILQQQDSKKLQEICNSNSFPQELKNLKECENITIQEVLHPELQVELIKMYVDDQATRGNLMEDVIERYGLNKDEISREDGITVDGTNRERLKEIFSEYGFPTKEMVGKEAMQGIFLMIQHSDGDPDWQKSQLTNIEMAVKKGDMDGQSYAYLYDRIQINSGKKQLYGTQFSNVDPINKTVTLAETEDIDSLDYRRMEVGMMPIEMYKELMLKNVQ